MKVQLVHKLEFHSTAPPTLGELKAMIKQAEHQGFNDETPVHIRAGEDSREHDYFFFANIGSVPANVPEVLDAEVR